LEVRADWLVGHVRTDVISMCGLSLMQLWGFAVAGSEDGSDDRDDNKL